MAYSEELAQRIREAVGADPAIDEKKMFGGSAIAEESGLGAWVARGLRFAGSLRPK